MVTNPIPRAGAGVRRGTPGASPGSHGDYETKRGVGIGEGRDLRVLEAGGAAGIKDFDFTDELDSFGVDHPKCAGGLEAGGEFRDLGEGLAIRAGEEDQVGFGFSGPQWWRYSRRRSAP